MTCSGRFSTCDGIDVRRVTIFPSGLHVAMCAGCRKAALAAGMDIRKESSK